MKLSEYNLLALRSDHLETILTWRNHPGVRENMYTNHVIGVREHVSWFDKVEKDESKKYFVFCCAGNPVGVVGFTEIGKVKNTATWAFYANPVAPRGTGSLMEFYALDYAFDNLKLHKLRCEVLAFNAPVIKLHEKYGFKVEGTMRDGHYDGKKFVDVVHLGIFSEEWRRVREKLANRLGLS